MRTQKTLELFYQPERDFWMVMVSKMLFKMMQFIEMIKIDEMLFIRLLMHRQNEKSEMAPNTQNINVMMHMKLFIKRF